MKYIFGIFFILFIYWFGAYMHESDIQRICKEKGRSGYSTWQDEIKCEPMDNAK